VTTQKQIDANRRNALKSTGPKSAVGKARSAVNAVSHGLTAEHVLIPGEDSEAFEAFREDLLADLAPLGAKEELLADRIVSAAWRLRRAGRMEGQVIEQGLEDRRTNRGTLGQLPTGYQMEAREPTADRVTAELLRWTTIHSKMARYEAHLERVLHKNRHELQRLQAARQGQQVAPPAAVDVDVSGLPEVVHSPAPAQGTGEEQGTPALPPDPDGRKIPGPPPMSLPLESGQGRRRRKKRAL